MTFPKRIAAIIVLIVLILIIVIVLLPGEKSKTQSANFNSSTVSNFIFDTIFIESLGNSYKMDEKVTEYHSGADMGGNTSIRNYDELLWKKSGYFQRNRDLGQAFIPRKDTRIQSIVLRTGPTENAVLYDVPGAKMFMQFYEVVGNPHINDNGTPKGKAALHGYTQNHRGDDYIEGVKYIPFDTIFTGIFPENVPITKDENNKIVGNEGRLHYIRWSFDQPRLFKKDVTYAFIFGFLEPGPGLRITVANTNMAAVSDAPDLNDDHTPYKGGWSFRREGDGTLPPTMYPGLNPPDNDSIRKQLINESTFGKGDERFLLPPTSNGFPDVDTYRALEFYIEESSD